MLHSGSSLKQDSHHFPDAQRQNLQLDMKHISHLRLLSS